jgi:TPR repeat protein
MAQDKMGDRIMRGAGIEADPVEALKWTLLAARQKVQASEERRFTLIASLPQDQIEEAIRRADAFSPKRGPVDAVPGETLEPQ